MPPLSMSSNIAIVSLHIPSPGPADHDRHMERVRERSAQRLTVPRGSVIRTIWLTSDARRPAPRGGAAADLRVSLRQPGPFPQDDGADEASAALLAAIHNN